MPDDVRSRFGPVAANYASSEFHAGSERIAELLQVCQPRADDVVLDAATGTGHTGLALAPRVRWVVGLDLTPEMLREAEAAGRERGSENVAWVIGDAHALPFPEAAFDLYTARAASHHFTDPGLALQEAFRVVRPGGRAVFIDCSAPPAARELLHEVEMRRDPSHVRSYTLDEWTRSVRAAGFVVEVADRRELDWDFDAWMGRMAVSDSEMAVLARQIEGSTGRAHQELRPERREGRLWHAYWHALIRARKPW